MSVETLAQRIDGMSAEALLVIAHAMVVAGRLETAEVLAQRAAERLRLDRQLTEARR